MINFWTFSSQQQQEEEEEEEEGQLLEDIDLCCRSR